MKNLKIVPDECSVVKMCGTVRHAAESRVNSRRLLINSIMQIP
jgi:hypothetical protein